MSAPPLQDPRPAFFGLLVVVAAWLTAAWAFWFVCDDAFISFRYARNWATGQGLGFNPGEVRPVEGYSNFLWMALAAGVEALGARPAAVMPALSLAIGAVFLVDLWRTLVDRLGTGPWTAVVAAATLAASPAFVVWGTSGLETMGAAWLLWRVVDGFVLSEVDGATRRAVVPALALALIRTEGIAWVAVVALLGLLVRASTRARPGDGAFALARRALAVASLYAPYFVWRWSHFGTLLSNTATAKVEADPERLARGFDYVAAYALESLAWPLWLALAALLLLRPRGRGHVVGALALGVPLFAVLVGGDFMTMGRLLVGGLAFQAAAVGLALAAAARRGARVGAAAALLALVVAGVGALPLADVQLVPEEVRRDFRVRFNSPVWRSELGQWRYMKGNAEAWERLGRALAATTRPGESIVLGAIGAAAYPTALRVHDRYGLVSREVAELPADGRRRRSPGHDKGVGVAFFLPQEPTYLSAELARPSGLKAAGQELLGWRSPDVRAGWAPELREVEVDGERMWLVLLARHPDPGPVWEAFPATLDETVRRARGR